MHYGSACVSSDDQNSALQRAALQRVGCMTICTDEGLADATVQRSALTRCLTALRSTWPPACAAPALAESPVVRAVPAPRGASTGEGDPGRGQLVRSPGQGQRHPQDWRGRCCRATIASPARPQGSPAGTACSPLACSKEIVMRGRHGTRPTGLCQHNFHRSP